MYRGKRVVADIYGNGAHMIVIPMDDGTTMWAYVRPFFYMQPLK